MKQKGDVQKRIVLIAAADGVDPGVVGVLRLVEMECPRSQIPESSQDRGEGDHAIEQMFSGEHPWNSHVGSARWGLGQWSLAAH